MKTSINTLVTRVGFILIPISFLIFLYSDNRVEWDMGPFLIFYAIAAFYGIYLLIEHKRSFFNLFSEENWKHQLLLLILLNISAFALNRSLPVFYESVDWLSVFLVIENTVLLLYLIFHHRFKRFIEWIFTGFLGISLVFHLYQSFVVFPYSVFGIAGFFMLGFPLLIFVPIFYLIAIIRILRRLEWTRNHWVFFMGAIVMLFGLVTYYLLQWKSVEDQLTSVQLSLDAPFQKHEFPDWIYAAQQLDDHYITDRYLKSGFLYQDINEYDDFFLAKPRFGTTSFEQGFMHDPLVALCLAIFETKLDGDSKLRILNFLYDSRHETADRFWSGQHLTTNQVVSNVEIFPEERLSFTELIITVDNTSRSSWSQEEAIYTFQLTEGSVVTSLSLWIDGEEQMGILSSKEKAQNAYDTIVGRQRRDPSVIYWMEGSQVRVRVFPCTPKEDRKFKIGVTAPLTVEGDRMIYSSMTFKGPDATNAKSAVYLITHQAELLESTLRFNKHNRTWNWQGDYQDKWYIQFSIPTFRHSSFAFQQSVYETELFEQQYSSFYPKHAYLDLNQSWTRAELSQLVNLFAAQKIDLFVNGIKVSYDQADKMDLTETGNFSLFPFHQLPKDEPLMVITKGGVKTPNLSDLEGSAFHESLFDDLTNRRTPIRVMDLNNESSDYLRSLKEFFVIDYHHATVKEIAACLASHEFPTNILDSTTISIPLNKTIVRLSDVSSNKGISAGSDHLMRLFYYQQIMKQIGRNYFGSLSKDVQSELVKLAATANVVTPLSSLIVLETQQDYNRFGIKEKTDSLGNASIQNAGAVPEPHEWALIILGIGFTIYVIYRSRLKWMVQ